MSENSPLQIRDTTANPAPLGLLGFGMTTVLLNFHNAGFLELNAMILSMGIFYGGCAQVIAGITEWKKGNTFGMTAFCSYGLFWITLAALLILPKAIPALAPKSEDSLHNSLGAMMAIWGAFTLVMFVGTLRLNAALMVVFGSLTILYALLTCAFLSGSATITTIAGYEGIFCGASAMYTGLAQVLNEVYGKTILPLCPMKK